MSSKNRCCTNSNIYKATTNIEKSKLYRYKRLRDCDSAYVTFNTKSKSKGGHFVK